jgi:signal transduction histidine kinase
MHPAQDDGLAMPASETPAHSRAPRRKFLATAFCLSVALAAAVSPSLGQDAPRQIFLLAGENPAQSGAAETEQAFNQRLKEKSPQPIEVFDDFLDLGRFPGEDADRRVVQALVTKFARKKPDLIVAISRNATTFLAQHRDEFARTIPAIYCCTPASTIAALHLPPDLPGVVVEHDWKGTFDLARRIQPTAKSLVIVSGASAIGLASQKDLIRQLQPQLRNYDVKYVTSSDEGKRLEEVSRLPRDSIVFLMPIYGEEETWYGPTQIAANIAKASSAPSYSAIPTLFGSGIVGGNLDNFSAQGTKAADLALEILSGKSPSALPRETRLPLAFRLDARQLERWKLSESSLPEGASVEFREPSLWERSRFTIVLVLLALAAQASIIAQLLLQKRKREAAEILLKESEDRLEAAADKQRKEIEHLMRVAILGELSGGIAHELGQPLSAIMANAQAAQKFLGGHDHDRVALTEMLDEIVRDSIRASDVIRSLRQLLKKDGEHKLTPVSLNDLVTSTLGLLHSELVKKGVSVTTNLTNNLQGVWGDPIQLQQVLLNLITNGIEAMASIPPAQRTLVITTRADETNVKVTITNHGASLSPDELKLIFEPYFTTKDRGLGLGLSICSRIVMSHGGLLTLSNADDGGVTAAVSLPLLAQARAS